MKALLERLLPNFRSRRPVAAPPEPAAAADDKPPFLWDVPRYPPFDSGLPIVPSAALLASQREITGRIYQGLGLSPECHERLAQPVLDAFASYAQLLPATRDAHYAGAGGLFRLGLETAAFALRRSEAVAFSPHETGEMRRRLEPVWRFGVFVGGLLNSTWAITETMTVTTASGATWSPYTRSLEAWAAEQGADVVFVNQRQHVAGTSRASTATLANRILTPGALEYLTGEGPRILAALMESVSGTARQAHHNVIDAIVAPTLATLIERDMAAAPHRFGKPVVGMHLEPYLVDAMVRALQHGIWRPNEDMGRVIILEQGTFLLWPLAGIDLRRQLAELNVPGVPETEEALLRLLVGAGVVETRREANGNEVLTHAIRLAEKRLTTVKLLEPRVLWREGPPAKHPLAVLEAAKAMAPVEGLPTLGVETKPAAGPAPTAPPAAPQGKAPAAAAAKGPKLTQNQVRPKAKAEPPLAGQEPPLERAIPAAAARAALAESGEAGIEPRAPTAALPSATTPLPEEQSDAAPASPEAPEPIAGLQRQVTDEREALKAAVSELAGAVDGRVGRRALVGLLRRTDNGEFAHKRAGPLGVEVRTEVLIVAERCMKPEGLDWDTIVSDLVAANILRSADPENPGNPRWCFPWAFPGGRKEQAIALRGEFLRFWLQFSGSHK